MLNCGVHKCPSKCHQLYDHSKMACEAVLDYTCPNNHRRTYRCHQPPPSSCVKCQKSAELADKKKQKDFEKQQKRDDEQREHAKRITKLDEEIEAEREAQKDQELARQRANALLQKQKDLADAKARTARRSAARNQPPAPGPSSLPPSTPAPSVPPSSNPPASAPIASAPPASDLPPDDPPPYAPYEPLSDIVQPSTSTSAPLDVKSQPPVPPSPPATPSSQQSASRPATPPLPTTDNTPPPLAPSKSEQEWQRQKDIEGADNPSIDAIMEMTGLEEVKAQVLRIKAKIDTTRRQGTSVADERFNVVLQGNPGTGTFALRSVFEHSLISVQGRRPSRAIMRSSLPLLTSFLAIYSSRRLGLV